MTADRDLQHPDITAAQATGYPRKLPYHAPERETAERDFIDETEDVFLAYCLANREIVEDYLSEHRNEFQDFQWSTYGEVAY